MTWVLVIVVLVVVAVVAAWAIPRARARRGHVATEAIPPSPGSTAGGGTPLLPGPDPPPSDEVK
jgi:hypothetical protein